MYRHIFVSLIGSLLLFAAPALGQLPGLAPPLRPVTTLTMQKSGSDIVLNWSTAPAVDYDYLVCRGIAHPEYRAEVIIAYITNGATTYTDTNALTRTRQGYPINEFYVIYAIPKNYKALAANFYQSEYKHRIKNSSLDIAIVATNGDVIKVNPETYYRTMRFVAAQVNSSKADIDIYNLPSIPESIGILARPAESYPNTVVHTGYYSALYDATPETDATYSFTSRQLPKPTVSRVGNSVNISWNQLTYDDSDAMAQPNYVAVRISIPALQLPDGHVMLYCLESPECVEYPVREYDAENNVWIYNAKIQTMLDKKWAVIASQRGKVAVATFYPRIDNNIAMQVLDLPAPEVIEQAGQYLIQPAFPAPLDDLVNRVNIVVDNQVYINSANITYRPAIVFANYYFTEGYDKWVTSAISVLQ